MYFDPVKFDFASALGIWAGLLGLILGSIGIISFLLCIVLYGGRGVGIFFRTLKEAFGDVFGTAPRRVWALTLLTMKESIRRKTLLVIVVFGVCFLFAGWFLSPGSSKQATAAASTAAKTTSGGVAAAITSPAGEGIGNVNIYVSFVLTAISYLILPAVFILACWTIPDDIKIRSMHTVVTKPVRRGEIYLGRILGITLVGTGIIVVMSIVGYFWLIRALKQEAQDNLLVARVPLYGELTFIDREGNPAKAGINTGDIWAFRSYIEGNSKSRAIWTFDGVYAKSIGDVLRLETNIQVFRSYRGELGTGVLCGLTFVNPTKKLRASYPPFPINEFKLNVLEIRRDALFDDTTRNKTVDLFDDLVDNGKLQVEVACMSGQQYLGMARPDLFIRKSDALFIQGFFKAVFGIWQMMFMLVVMGVTASCFVKGPVATLLTLTVVIVGKVAREFLKQLVDEGLVIETGGPIESIYRLVTHMNTQLPLPEGFWTKIIKGIDEVFVRGLVGAKFAFPDFTYYDLAPYIANGYDIPWDAALLPGISVTLAYLIPCFLVGYFSLKMRELEAK